MDAKELTQLRELLFNAIDKQLPEKERVIAHAITTVLTGMAFDLGRIADALETDRRRF